MTLNKIKKLREQIGLTQDDMAFALNISQNAYCLIENGKTKLDIERLFKIAEVLKVDPNSLLDYSDTTFNFYEKVENGYASYIQNLNADNKDLISALKEQLQEKDKQIEYLLCLLKK